jgi:hypothetical protein
MSPSRKKLKRPSRRFGTAARGFTDWSIDKVIQELVEFNQWQAYSYSREQLIDKLDAALKAADELQCLNCSE